MLVREDLLHAPSHISVSIAKTLVSITKNGNLPHANPLAGMVCIFASLSHMQQTIHRKTQQTHYIIKIQSKKHNKRTTSQFNQNYKPHTVKVYIGKTNEQISTGTPLNTLP